MKHSSLTVTSTTVALTALLLASCGSDRLQRSSEATPTERIDTDMSFDSIQAGAPAIDLAAPKNFETATFALG